jgi:hypothetical protein
MTVLVGEDIQRFRFLTLVSGLKLEMKGLKVHRGRSCYAILKKDFGLEGNTRAKVLAEAESRRKLLLRVALGFSSKEDMAALQRTVDEYFSAALASGDTRSSCQLLMEGR